MNRFSAFCSEYSRARSSTARSRQVIDSVCVAVFMTRVFTWSISCLRSTVTVAATAKAYLSHAVHWRVTHYSQ